MTSHFVGLALRCTLNLMLSMAVCLSISHRMIPQSGPQLSPMGLQFMAVPCQQVFSETCSSLNTDADGIMVTIRDSLQGITYMLEIDNDVFISLIHENTHKYKDITESLK